MPASSTPPALVCLGEILARLSTPNHLPLADTPALELHFGGAETNVAVQFSELGASAALVSLLPRSPLADAALEKIAARRVDTRHVFRQGNRMGLYFLESGHGARPSTVTYDRTHTAFSMLRPGLFAWESILSGARWFHWSGITPPLGDACAAACEEAITAARTLGVKVSCDVNFRAGLWSPAQAAATLPPLVANADLCLCGATEAQTLLGATPSPDADSEEARFVEVARSMQARHGVKVVAMLIRGGKTADEGSLRGLLVDSSGTPFLSRTHPAPALGRIGSGDSFAGALLFALNAEWPPSECVEFAAAAAAWKHSVAGDWSRGGVPAIQALALGASGATIRR
ncbi:MAG: 2-dehydro-3-deoxygluconokinase [Verrucomicrobiota bacterium]|jgi:2-dehydro-3-deoxygluconokinase